jgi:Arm DNA-binding domain
MLTDNIVAELAQNPPVKRRSHIIFDGDCPGFGFRVTQGGACAFVLNYRNHEGRQRCMTIGRSPEMPVKTARVIAIKQKAKIAAGYDPIEQKLLEQQQRAVKSETFLSRSQILSLPLPSPVGVYFLILGQTVQYVGQSANVFARLLVHQKAKRIPFDRWRWIECAEQELDYAEAGYIRILKPPHNVGVHYAARRQKRLSPRRPALTELSAE